MLATDPTVQSREREPNAEIRAQDYLYLVRRVAERMARRLPRAVDLGDLISAGTVGLIDAVAKYDAQRCDRFVGYAEIRIRGAILDELRAMDWVPRSVRAKGHRLDEALATLAGSLGRAPSDTEVAELLGVDQKAHDEMRRDVRNIAVVAIEDVSADGFAAFAADERTEPGRELEERELKECLARAVLRLPERERQVLSLYYVEELRLKEIGEVFGITESRVCQIHAQAIGRLRKLVAVQEWTSAAPARPR